MKYKLEVENRRSVETLTVDGKEYRREGFSDGNGLTVFNGEFNEILEENGIEDEQLLENVYDALDDNFFISNVIYLTMKWQ